LLPLFILTGFLLLPPLVLVLPIEPLLLSPLLRIVGLELRPHSILGVTDAFESILNRSLCRISIGHALPILAINFALATLAAGIVTDCTGIR
jgi:hypothetical protein